MQQKVLFGTHGVSSVEVLREAASCGYEVFDSADSYRNHAQIAQVLKENPMLKVQTKVAPQNLSFEKCAKFVLRALEELGRPQIDCMLLHFPAAKGLKHSDPRNKERRLGAWKALEEAHKAGQVAHIGVSNFQTRHLEELLAEAQVRPRFNQVEMHPLYWDHELLHFCHQQGIQLQAYCPLA